MPLYDYSCELCGPFREWQSMSHSSDPMACPTCDGQSKRAIVAPYLADMDPHRRIAHQRNEKSAHEPKLATKGHRDHPMRGGSEQTGRGNRRRGHNHGPSRPWMIGH